MHVPARLWVKGIQTLLRGINSSFNVLLIDTLSDFLCALEMSALEVGIFHEIDIRAQRRVFQISLKPRLALMLNALRADVGWFIFISLVGEQKW
jgi:hypothetical protein